MNNETFTFYAKYTNESIEKQLDLMAHRLREMAASVESAKAHAQPIEGSPVDAKQQLIQSLDSLRYATNHVHTNLMSKMRIDLATDLMVQAGKLIGTKVED